MRTHTPLPSNTTTPLGALLSTYSTRQSDFLKGLWQHPMTAGIVYAGLGAVMALAWPPSDWGWALPLGWLAFTACIQAAASNLSHPFKQGALVGFLMGIGLYGLLIHWMLGLHPLTWTGLSVWGSWGIVLAGWGVWTLLGGVGMAAVGAGWAALLRWGWFAQQSWPVKALLEAGIVGAFWVTAPKLLARLTDVFIPWASVVDAMLDPLMTLPLGRWLLTHGGVVLTEWVLVSGLTLVATTVQSWIQKKRGAGVGLLVIVGVVAGLTLSVLTQPEKPEIIVSLGLPPLTIVQANVPIEAIRSPQSRQWVPSSYELWLKKQHPRQHSKPNHLYLMPEEGIIKGTVDETLPNTHTGFKRLQLWANNNNATLAFGGTSWVQGPKKTQYFNSLLVMQPQKAPQFYKKQALVPFGEVVPQWIRGVSNAWQVALLQGIGFPYIPNLKAGEKKAPLQLLSNVWAAPLICFEAAFPELLADKKKYPYQAIVVVSNLGWLHHHPALAAQYLQKARILAASNQLPVLLAANSGPSAIISPKGTVLCQLPPNTAGTLTWTPHPTNPSSPLCQAGVHPIQ